VCAGETFPVEEEGNAAKEGVTSLWWQKIKNVSVAGM